MKILETSLFALLLTFPLLGLSACADEAFDEVEDYDPLVDDEPQSGPSVEGLGLAAADGEDAQTQGLGAWDYCSPWNRCGHGQGDCDSEQECLPGLWCVENVGADYGWNPAVDVCQNPVIPPVCTNGQVRWTQTSQCCCDYSDFDNPVKKKRSIKETCVNGQWQYTSSECNGQFCNSPGPCLY